MARDSHGHFTTGPDGTPCPHPQRQLTWQWDRGRLKPHGTMAAVRRHRRRSERLCESCRQAEQRDAADRRTLGRAA